MIDFFVTENIKKAALFFIVLTSSAVFSQQITSSSVKNGEVVILEEKWKGITWASDLRKTRTYDSAGNFISELIEKWNGTRYEKESLVVLVMMVYNIKHQP